jgi:HSP20 family protein
MTLHSLIPRRSYLRARETHPALRAFWSADLDRFFDEAFAGFGRVPVTGFAPPVDVDESDEAYTVRADLPGLEEKDIEVSLDDGVLRIQGKLESGREEERKGRCYVERASGSFQRAIALPAEVDAENVKASYKQGVLTVTLPKRADAQPTPRRVPITSA